MDFLMKCLKCDSEEVSLFIEELEYNEKRILVACDKCDNEELK